MQKVEAIPLSEHNSHAQLDKRLQMWKFVFVWVNAAKKPLKQPYEGPHQAIKRTTKHLIINKKGEKKTISLYKIKPASYEYQQEKQNTITDKQTIINYYEIRGWWKAKQ